MADTGKDMKAVIDFDCLDKDCGQTISFNLMSLTADKGLLSCPACHRPYQFDRAFLRQLEKLRTLILAVQDAEDILDATTVSVNTPAGEVKIPYRLLLTRLNTLISLEVSGRKIDFNFRIEPLAPETFR